MGVYPRDLLSSDKEYFGDSPVSTLGPLFLRCTMWYLDLVGEWELGHLVQCSPPPGSAEGLAKPSLKLPIKKLLGDSLFLSEVSAPHCRPNIPCHYAGSPFLPKPILALQVPFWCLLYQSLQWATTKYGGLVWSDYSAPFQLMEHPKSRKWCS